jgi:hypothetical protein
VESESDRGDVTAPRMEGADHQSIVEKIGDGRFHLDVILIAVEPSAARKIVLGDAWPEAGGAVEGVSQSGREGA